MPGAVKKIFVDSKTNLLAAKFFVVKHINNINFKHFYPLLTYCTYQIIGFSPTCLKVCENWLILAHMCSKIELINYFHAVGFLYRKCFISCQNLESAKKFKNAINKALAYCSDIFW